MCTYFYSFSPTASFTQVTLFIASPHSQCTESFYLPLLLICFRWRVSEWSNCSTNCGSGHQHRTVECIHEVTRGHENTIILPESKCPLPVPKSKRFCNIVNCTAKWITEPWSNCNRKCGSTGTMIRSVLCVRQINGQNVPVDHNLCTSVKPASKKSCNHGSCYNSYEPKIGASGGLLHHKSGKTSKLIVSSNDALYIQQEPIKRVTVKVGGKAVLFEGTTVKIRCPRKKSPHKVEWSKDRRKLNYTSHIQLTPKFALRIKNLKASDAGIYTCTVGPSQASIIITLKSTESISMKKQHYSNGDLLQNVNTSKSTFNKVPFSSASDSLTTEVSNEVSIRSFDFSTLETRYVSDERQEIGEFDQVSNVTSNSGNGNDADDVDVVNNSPSITSTNDYASIFYYGIERVVQGFARSSASSRLKSSSSSLTTTTLPQVNFFQLLLTPFTCALERVLPTTSTLLIYLTTNTCHLQFNIFHLTLKYFTDAAFT